MSGWVSFLAEAVQSAAASAATAFIVALLLAGTTPSRFGVAGTLARCVAASLVGIAAVLVCLIVPRFVLVYGAAAWPSALRSSARNVEVPLVAIATLGAGLSVLKTALLLRTRFGKGWIAADLVASVVIAVAFAAAYRWIWHVRTGLDPDGGLVDFFWDQRVRAAVLCLPMAASGWICVSTALVGRPDPSRRRLLACIAAAGAGLLGGLLAPF